MGMFRKKPVIIEARRLTVDSIHELERWCGGSIKGTALPIEEQVIAIQTLEGEHLADMGDYIIKGVVGEFYPCKPHIFEMTYEEVSND